MGRPLNKKYFNPKPSGNVGDAVASYTFTNRGTYADNEFPTVTVSAPGLPGGVTATGTLTMRVKSTTVTVAGTGAANEDYDVGDVLTLVGGTATTAATWSVASVRARTIGIQNAGTNAAFALNDTITFSTGWDTPAVAVVTGTNDAGGPGIGVVTSLTFLNPSSNKGVRTTAIPSDPITPDSTSNVGGLQGLTVNIGFEINTITNTNLGNYTALPANPAATTTDSTTGGTGATLTVTWEVRDFAVTSGGSGYTSAADAAITFDPASTTAATATLAPTATNVILAHARVVGSASVLDADIAKQVSTNDYVMSTTDGTSKVALTTTNTPPAGGAYIVATDANGSTYWVTKLTAHRATLVRRSMNGSYLHPNGGTAAWSFDSPSLLRVQIENI